MKLTAKELIRLQKETHLLEHGFYDEEINKSLSEWAENIGRGGSQPPVDEYNWLRDELKNNIFPSPPYNKEYFMIVLSELAYDDNTESRKYQLASNLNIRSFWFRTKFPEFFKDEE